MLLVFKKERSQSEILNSAHPESAAVIVFILCHAPFQLRSCGRSGEMALGG